MQVIGYVPTGLEAVAVLVQTGAVVNVTDGLAVYVNAGSAAPTTRVLSFAVTVSAAGLTVSVPAT